MVHDFPLFLSLVLESVVVVEARVQSRESRNRLLQSLNLEDLFNGIAEGTPVEKVAVHFESFH